MPQFLSNSQPSSFKCQLSNLSEPVLGIDHYRSSDSSKAAWRHKIRGRCRELERVSTASLSLLRTGWQPLESLEGFLCAALTWAAHLLLSKWECAKGTSHKAVFVTGSLPTVCTGWAGVRAGRGWANCRLISHRDLEMLQETFLAPGPCALDPQRSPYRRDPCFLSLLSTGGRSWGSYPEEETATRYLRWKLQPPPNPALWPRLLISGQCFLRSFWLGLPWLWNRFS